MDLYNDVHDLFEFLDDLDDLDDLQSYAEYIDFTKQAEERNRQISRRKYDRRLPDIFTKYDDDEFKQRFRFKKSTVRNMILPQIEENLQFKNRRGLPLPTVIQLLVALRYYSTGNFKTVLSDFQPGLTQATCSRVVAKVSTLLAQQVRNHVHFPKNLTEVKNKFEILGSNGDGKDSCKEIGNVIGVVDGTHIKIATPRNVNHPEAFKNEYGYSSIHVQIVAGPDLKIYDIVCRHPGMTNKDFIFRHSRLHTRLMSGEIDGVLIGNDQYPSDLPFLLRRMENATTKHERRYNETIDMTRSVFSKCLDVLKNRFPCLQKTFATELSTSAHVIVACSVLHNIGLSVGDIWMEIEDT